jgi:hypothetical protein
MLTSHTPTPGLTDAAQDASRAIIATQDIFLISLVTIYSPQVRIEYFKD